MCLRGIHQILLTQIYISVIILYLLLIELPKRCYSCKCLLFTNSYEVTQQNSPWLAGIYYHIRDRPKYKGHLSTALG
nr:MAG TPA: hypothetical protein [Caudoviricetes sp.]